MSETLRDVIAHSIGVEAEDLADIGRERCAHIPEDVLDSLVYRSCPECGGSRKCRQCNGRGEFTRYNADGPETRFGEPPPTPQHYEDECDNCHGDGVCPACADAPVAIVETALREKGIDLLHPYLRDGDPHTRGEAGELFDTVLSTVLGHVRYAKEMGQYVHGNRETGEASWVDSEQQSNLHDGDPIAILEEAGKEE